MSQDVVQSHKGKGKKEGRKRRKELMVSEVTRMEDEMYKIKAEGGRWTNWEALINKVIM